LSKPQKPISIEREKRENTPGGKNQHLQDQSREKTQRERHTGEVKGLQGKGGGGKKSVGGHGGRMQYGTLILKREE